MLTRAQAEALCRDLGITWERLLEKWRSEGGQVVLLRIHNGLVRRRILAGVREGRPHVRRADGTVALLNGRATSSFVRG